jgi:predicted alpha/beta superfamily hydrolase
MFGRLEDVIIVGIEYEWQQSLTPWMTSRWKDFTPTTDSTSDENPAYKKAFGLPDGSLTSGNASVFLTVMRNEIIPFIDKEYKTTANRGISGHSLGGLFVSYCLFSAPKLFNRYGINSPSLWWDNKEMFNIEKSFSEQHKILPVNIFMSVGSLEGKLMTPVMTEFADTLRSRNYNGLHLTTHIFEDETHTSVVPAMISRTLMVLYGVKNK